MSYARITDVKMIKKSTISQIIEGFRPDTITDFINSGNMVFVDTPPLSWFRNYRSELLPHPTKGDSRSKCFRREPHGFEFLSAWRYSVFQHEAICYPATFIHSFGKCKTSLENVKGSVAYRLNNTSFLNVLTGFINVWNLEGYVSHPIPMKLYMFRNW